MSTILTRLLMTQHDPRYISGTCPPCTHDCAQGRMCRTAHSRDACAPEGGKHANPAPTTSERRSIGIGVALTIAPALAAVVAWAIYLRWPI